MIVLAAAALLTIAQNRDSTLERIQARIQQEPGAQVGLAYIDLALSDTLFLNPDTDFHAASTMKVPVMIELFRRASTGSFAMGQGLMIVNSFASIVDGSPYALDPNSDSDTTLYHRVGTRVPVDTLLRLHDHSVEQLRDEHPDRTRRRRPGQPRHARAGRSKDSGAPRCRGQQGFR